mmetsp:Transcript_5838/g.14231  ORF Transcript_5838/g.14231 Transcript_5838/m.14231 type:complete len:105 (-) Transcript_5838:201-515(-)
MTYVNHATGIHANAAFVNLVPPNKKAAQDLKTFVKYINAGTKGVTVEDFLSIPWLIVVEAVQVIEIGQEIFTDYGPNYWPKAAAVMVPGGNPVRVDTDDDAEVL